MKKPAGTDHRSEHPDKPKDQDASIEGKTTEERIRHTPADDRVRNDGRKARKRSENTPPIFGNFPSMH